LRKYTALSSAFCGNFIEYYDYALFGFLAPVIAREFFQTQDPLTALIQSFMVFALGSFAKPLGGYLFGRLGDRKGRKVALQCNMLGIALTTLALGLLPGYQTLGLAAPILLVVCRLIQGIFLGGEIDGIRIYVLEHLSQKAPCFANSLSSFTASLGVAAAASIVGFALSPDLPTWAWRLPVLLGGFIALVLYGLRASLTETASFLSVQKAPFQPFFTIFKKHFRIWLAIFALGGSVGGVYYFYFVFLVPFYSKLTGILTPAAAATTFSHHAWVFTLVLPLVGFAADRWKIKKPLFLGGLGLLCFLSLMAIQNPATLLGPWAMVAFCLAMACFNVPTYVLLLEKTPIHARYRLFSTGHSLGALCFASSAPTIAAALWQKTELPWVPFTYLLFLTLLGGLGFYLLRKAP